MKVWYWCPSVLGGRSASLAIILSDISGLSLSTCLPSSPAPILPSMWCSAPVPLTSPLTPTRSARQGSTSPPSEAPAPTNKRCSGLKEASLVTLVHYTACAPEVGWGGGQGSDEEMPPRHTHHPLLYLELSHKCHHRQLQQCP